MQSSDLSNSLQLVALVSCSVKKMLSVRYANLLQGIKQCFDARNTSVKRAAHSFAVTYENFGHPAKVLKISKLDVPKLCEGQVMVKMLAAPVNPADINMIQGVYPIKPATFPAVGGNESVGEVVEVSDSVKTLRIGDWVLPAQSGSGTWTTLKVADESDLVRVPNDIPVVSAATLTVNPRTAYRMLVDFEQLEKGDAVIQNGANSGVGQAVIQIASKMGLKTINIVRNRPDLSKLVEKLRDIGASQVVTDEMLKTDEAKSLMKSLPKPKLALNCVGGKASADLLKYLDRGGTLVTYGGMSKQPLMIPAGPLIFSDAKVRGFWVTQWTKENRTTPANEHMTEYLTAMIRAGELQPPFHNAVKIEDFASAIQKSMESYVSEKQILVP